LAALEQFFQYVLAHPIILGILAVLAAVAFGYGDMLRFRMRRVNAIAGVCFRESIRRRILWITPLAIVGVVVVSQLQKSSDEQDAIRQTTKYCLFVSGLIVVVAAIILACTNLPKEIESRVIYTIVTKPTTRLEIVLGKVQGFAAVSAVILLIMGAFTWGYLQVRSAAMMARVNNELKNGELSPGLRSTYSHYASAGLLSVKSLEMPSSLEESSRIPDKSGIHWLAGGTMQYYPASFVLSEDDVKEMQSVGGAVIAINLRVQKHEPTSDEKAQLSRGSFIKEADPNALVSGPRLPTTGPVHELSLIPQIGVQITDENGTTLAKNELNTEMRWPKFRPDLKYEDHLFVPLPLPQDVLKAIFGDNGKPLRKFKVEVQGTTPSMEYGVDADSVELLVPLGPKNIIRIKPQSWDNPGTPAGEPKIYARLGRTGMQIKGEAGGGAVGIFRFDHVDVPADPASKLSLQVKVILDRSGDLDANQNVASAITVQVRNRRSGVESPAVRLEPETGRASYVDVSQADVAGGDFDVYVRGLTPGQNVSLQGPTANTPSIALATADHSFNFNLFKSLLILWLLSVLVVTVSVFCSTFLSWPIAVVLTLLLLLARWGVDELGDSLSVSGVRTIAGDIFNVRDPAPAAAMTDSLQVLTDLLRNGVRILPDISQFPAFEDIERGVNIKWPKLEGALTQTFGYGIPIVLLTYLILKRKEVAP
jgi:hypothetical protein